MPTGGLGAERGERREIIITLNESTYSTNTHNMCLQVGGVHAERGERGAIIITLNESTYSTNNERYITNL